MKRTNKVCVLAVLVMAVLTMADQSRAETLRYRTGGAWENVSDGTTPGWGVNPDQPGSSVPVAGDEARVNWAGSTVTLDYAAPAFERLLIGVDEAGTMEVNGGGVLSAIQDVVVGNNNFTEGYMDVNDGATVNVGRILWVGKGGPNDGPGDTLGYLNINSGGVVNVANHLWWGVKGTAEVNISGTLNQTGGILGLGTINALDSGAQGGTALVNILDGGIMALNNIHAGGTQSSIQPGSYIDISGSGQLTLPGDFVGVLEGYRDASKLYGNGVPGAVDINVVPAPGGLGDFDVDGDVDGHDFLVWQRDPNVGVLADWQANYGQTSMKTVVTAAVPIIAVVPEPSVLTLMLTSALALSGLRSRSCR
ncbi:hypothetical protein [Bythopirellula polymerisocia]|uniref:PEP-CTERM protein-sorting domain-containing protein n=1 Tax=Bythopirellula polymerisocia TaxID=2528003 RepID=A0A5C6CE90_9BACT|nr:hypothetical protein [Bythopirellula polymerisocia]TWU21824.1 hypothetical protein Pla144_45200 [Bythopirellula polymerisocia]